VLGAEVVKVEPPEGDSLRRHAPFQGGREGVERSLPWQHFRRGARGIVLDLERSATDREAAHRLLAGADVLLENRGAGGLAELGLDRAALTAANPGLIVTSVTPFGASGPRSEWLGTDLIGYATGGMMALTGEPDQPPVRLGGGQADQLAGMYAALGTLCALTARARTGRGRFVDVSVQEAVASTFADAGITFFQLNDGMNPTRVGTEHPVVVPVFACPCKDGHMLINASETHQFRGLVAWAASTGAYVEPLEDPAFDQAMNRLPMRDLVNALISDAASGCEKATMYEELQARSVPVTPISSTVDLETNPQLVAREFFDRVELDGGGEARDAGAPLRFAGRRPLAALRAPRLGEHGEELAAEQREPTPSPAEPIRSGRPWADAARSLDGLRVVDFSWALAGPWAGRLLAREGAEVIRVESGVRLDMLRQMAPEPELAGAFINANAGKLGFCVDLKDPDGVELARQLAASADVVLDNFRPGVMERLGLDQESLAKRNPRIITASMPAQGESGPHREFVSYGPGLHALAGFTYMTGYPDGPPTAICTGFVDQLAAAHAAAAILAEVRRRDLTGEGRHVELSQFEAAVGMLGSAVLEHFADGVTRTRQGNADDNFAPHGIYRCRGEDAWVAIAVDRDSRWPPLARAIGADALADDPGLASAAGRRARAAEIDAAIEAWCAGRDAEAAAVQLQAAGVPAGKFQTVGDLLEHDPHLRERGFYERANHPRIGEVWLDGGAFEIEGEAGDLHGRAGPLLGQHTRELARDLLGLDDERIDALAAAGTIVCAERAAG
jgi:crotonobetainyl-CoA:carnitine CoA-transferase CaiB-like acyl-CoA transferase